MTKYDKIMRHKHSRYNKESLKMVSTIVLWRLFIFGANYTRDGRMMSNKQKQLPTKTWNKHEISQQKYLDIFLDYWSEWYQKTIFSDFPCSQIATNSSKRISAIYQPYSVLKYSSTSDLPCSDSNQQPLSQKTDALTNCAILHKNERSGWNSGGEPQSILC